MYSKLIFLVFLQLNLIGNCNELSAEEIQELWVQADIDGNGVVDYKEFKVNISNWKEMVLILSLLEFIFYMLILY